MNVLAVGFQVAVEMNGAHADVPRPDGVIVLATERAAAKPGGQDLGGMNGGPTLNGSAGHGSAHGGDVEMGMRPSQPAKQSSAGDGRDDGLVGKDQELGFGSCESLYWLCQ